ncbi:MAG: hypothetical protein APR62_00170 [Smithella sp. SDB]|nr:MAG: hypothetical protein APR62_00170 [Smithella sp. SDB]
MNNKHQNNLISGSDADLKFIADASLAKLAKWMRLLGYDTVVYSKEAGREMLRQADAEGRIVLTRRKDMVERQFSGILFLVTDVIVSKQLNAVIEKLFLEIDRRKMFSICLECNQKLQGIGKNEVRDLVPSYVFENCDRYNKCPRCGKIYWMGTHPRNALKFMEKHIPSHLP